MAIRFPVDSSLQVYDTARRTLVPFEPLVRGEVRMYVCGVTVYDVCHIGHGRSYLVWDMVRRYLEFRGYRVLYVQNFTDIDDKIIARARELGTTERELALHNIDEYFRDMNALGIRPADVFPRATTHIPTMAALVRDLLACEAAYLTPDGSVYFRVSRFPRYGQLSGRKLEDMMAGARVEVSEEKEHPMDFAVWKAAKPGEPFWEIAVNGKTLRGRPGWHLECSAMVRQHLGETIDIHCGGTDLIFPHHENEIAQSMAVTGKPLARYWLHNGFINIEGTKMSKSLRNFITLRELLQSYDGDTIRYFVLQKHYRSPMDFTEEALEAAKSGLMGLRRSSQDLRDALEVKVKGRWLGPDEHRFKQMSHDQRMQFLQEILLPKLKQNDRDAFVAFLRAMDQDFGTPEALAVITNYVRSLHEYFRYYVFEVNAPREPFKDALDLAKELAGSLGLSLETPARPAGSEVDIVGSLVEYLLGLRQQAREVRDYARADAIRKRLEDLGIEINDQPGKSTWRFRA